MTELFPLGKKAYRFVYWEGVSLSATYFNVMSMHRCIGGNFGWTLMLLFFISIEPKLNSFKRPRYYMQLHIFGIFNQKSDIVRILLGFMSKNVVSLALYEFCLYLGVHAANNTLAFFLSQPCNAARWIWSPKFGQIVLFGILFIFERS